jgi:SAM-dependent methyltransferase
VPSSFLGNVPVIVRTLADIDPRSVLDVGPGYGRYGFLFRERLDDFRWERRLDGVDVFPDYLERSRTAFLYDRFFTGDFLAVELPAEYDLVMMIDVLEHFSDDDGERALDKALALAPRVLIASPLGVEQGAMYGNPHEEHLSEWPSERLEQFAAGRGGSWDRVPGGMGRSVIGILARDGAAGTV